MILCGLWIKLSGYTKIVSKSNYKEISLVLCVFLSVFHTYRLYVYRVVNKCRCNNINNCIGPTEDFITLTKTRSISIKMTAYYQGLTQKTIHNTNTEILFSLMLMNKHKL